MDEEQNYKIQNGKNQNAWLTEGWIISGKRSKLTELIQQLEKDPDISVRYRTAARGFRLKIVKEVG